MQRISNKLVLTNPILAKESKYNDIKRKRLLLLLVALIAAAAGMQAQKRIQTIPDSDRFTTISGSYNYEFDKDGYVTKLATNDYAYNTMVVRIAYANTGGVGDVLADDVSLSIYGRHVTATEGTAISAYDLQGRMVGSSADGSLELPQAGIYIVRAGAKAVKVAVR